VWLFWDRFAPGHPTLDAILGFEVGAASPARLMQPMAVAALRHALAIGEAGDLAGAEDALVAALAAQRPALDAFTIEIVRLRARLAFEMGALARADSLNQEDLARAGASASYFGLAARIAARTGRSREAQQLAHQALTLRPGDPEAQDALDELGAAPGADRAEF
jgi:hypothetical protein